MSNAPERLRTIIDSVELSGIRLQEITAKGGALPPRSAFSVDIDHSARVIEKTAKGFTITAGIALRALAAGRHQTPDSKSSKRLAEILSVSATLELRYELRNAGKFSTTDLTRFANINGIYNAWPYWRELIQDICLRLGLPPVILPVFRIQRPDPPADSPAARGRDRKKQSTK